MKAEGSISAIIVNYNGKAFLQHCLDSLMSHECILEVIVVDNGSADGSLEEVKALYPAVGIIRSGGNVGFGRACNLGAGQAKGDCLLLLNYDAEFLSGLDSARAHLGSHPEVGMVGGRLCYPDGRSQPSVGRALRPLRLVCSWLPIARLFPDQALFSREILAPEWYLQPHEDVDWITGALMLIRRSDWNRVNGMDPAFFLYVEDVDLCTRLRELGLRLDFQPDFRAIHLMTGGTGIVSRRALLSTIDSYKVYLRKHHPAALVSLTLLGLALVFLLRSLALLLWMTRGKHSRIEAATYLRGAYRSLRLGLGHKFPWGPPT